MKYRPLIEENTFNMKDPVKPSFHLPTHVLFQNSPRLSKGSDTRALVSPAAFHKDVFHIGMEIIWRHLGVVYEKFLLYCNRERKVMSWCLPRRLHP